MSWMPRATFLSPLLFCMLMRHNHEEQISVKHTCLFVTLCACSFQFDCYVLIVVVVVVVGFSIAVFACISSFECFKYSTDIKIGRENFTTYQQICVSCVLRHKWGRLCVLGKSCNLKCTTVYHTTIQTYYCIMWVIPPKVVYFRRLLLRQEK